MCQSKPEPHVLLEDRTLGQARALIRPPPTLIPPRLQVLPVADISHGSLNPLVLHCTGVTSPLSYGIRFTKKGILGAAAALGEWDGGSMWLSSSDCCTRDRKVADSHPPGSRVMSPLAPCTQGVSRVAPGTVCRFPISYDTLDEGIC